MFNFTKPDVQRNKILHATFKCIYRYGVSGITMQSVAKEAKVSQALLHYYFTNKATLIKQCIEALFTKFINDVQERYLPSDPPEKKLDAYFEAAKYGVKDKEKLFTVVIHVWAYSTSDSTVIKHLNTFNERLLNIFITIIEEGKQRGLYKGIDAEELGRDFLASLIGTGILWHLNKKAFSFDEHLDTVTTRLKQHIRLTQPGKLTQKNSFLSSSREGKR